STASSCPSRTTGGPPAVGQSRALWSMPALAMYAPSGEIATAHTAVRWPTSLARTRPLTSQVATVRSPELASHVPSGAIAPPVAPVGWPGRVLMGAPSAPQIRTVPSTLALASHVPSGAIATPATASACPRSVGPGPHSTARRGGLIGNGTPVGPVALV